MRVHFQNIGQADRYLKSCKLKITQYLGRSHETRLPSQRVRNAFCQGFGYSSYDELRRVLSDPAREAKPLPSEEDFLNCLTKGFSLALEVAVEYGRPEDVVDQLMMPNLAQSAAEEFKRVGSARLLFTQTPRERAEEIMDEAWSILHNGDPRVPPAEDLLSEAEEQFRQAVSANPDLADAYNGLAFVALTRGNYTAARLHSEAALEKARKALGGDEPEIFSSHGSLATRPYMRARHNLGLSLMRLGQPTAAVREFEEVVRRSPNQQHRSMYLIGPLYHRVGDLRRAISAYRKTAGNGERSGEPHNEFSFALALYEQGSHEEAVLRMRYGAFRNLHIPQVLLGMPVERLDIWYGNDEAEPAKAADYEKEYGHLWEGKTGALALLRAVYLHPTVQSEIEEFLDLHRRLDATRDVGARMPIAEEISRFQSLLRLKRNNKMIATAAAKEARQ